jgi:uncharacterized spore protein YtfJ
MSEQSLIERIAETIQVHASAKQVYGEPVERDGTTIIPVAKVQWGFGGGGFGRGPVERGGGGGGARAFPTGYIELRNGVSEFHAISSQEWSTLLSAGAIGFIGAIVLTRLLRR